MKQIIYPRIGETVYRETLPNGLPVCVVTKPGYRRAYALFATRYGGMDMRFALNGEWLDTPAGIAHYLEHKMFDTEEGNALQILAQNGAEPNAFTSNAVTAYYFDSTEHFFENLRVLLSFVSVPYFTDESVQKERGIISQEIGMIEDNPEWQVYKNLIGLLYRSSPARVPVAGSVESIAGITAQTLYDCHKAFYTPGNMCLTVVGDVDPQEVLRLAREVLPAGSGPAIPRDYGEEEDLTPHEKEKTVRMEVSMPTFLLGFKCAPVGDGPEQMRQNLIGELACDVLMGESSPLYARLYSEGLINGSFGYSFDILPGAAYVYAGGDSNDPHAVKAAILAETERLLKDGIDADYWMQLQRANFGSTLKSLNSFESVAMSAVEGCFHGYDRSSSRSSMSRFPGRICWTSSAKTSVRTARPSLRSTRRRNHHLAHYDRQPHQLPWAFRRLAVHGQLRGAAHRQPQHLLVRHTHHARPCAGAGTLHAPEGEIRHQRG